MAANPRRTFRYSIRLIDMAPARRADSVRNLADLIDRDVAGRAPKRLPLHSSLDRLREGERSVRQLLRRRVGRCAVGGLAGGEGKQVAR